uniref:D-lactate dehydrogenase (cytochrome) n=1 Tax=Chromera velia CCMP2878 TaxID=1169474 RepID=A0A0G4HAD1_9ALVE|eukprot:Cvel_6082.t1-p1 / transcript=Cvel_6082.t1 / gene=Cvel_6082 / organism=Chromera_velia_CCMP2878 / gene_product=D-lactate dehydrogenase [cytochrome], mitochondrial, putative / transcript_product=D-lactate dehydrogenase [cytochrome], mitochondrial, putative / location=Cvel_scaffold293:11678-15404(-) / protein_length=517 / sequence_SO=supercontig / SO=protein_coding / is_pseudo=false
MLSASFAAAALASASYLRENSRSRALAQQQLQQQQKSIKSLPFGEAYPEAEKALIALLGERLSTDEGHLEDHGKEASGYAARSNPQAVAFPESTEEVSGIMKICNDHKIPVVPYAAGTSLEGHTIATHGGLSISMQNLDKVLSINKEDMDIVVQPGVGWMELNDILEPYGFFLGVDPGPGAQIGGMCGTRCSGTKAVKYGTMKDQVVSLTVVMADGTVVKTGQRPKKSSAGYDLARLFVGSEGTLGVVTEAVLKVRNIPECTEVAYVSFDTVRQATDTVIQILQRGIQMGGIELLDEVMVKAVNEYSGTKLPVSPLVLFKFVGAKEHVRHDVKVVGEIVKQHTNNPYRWAEDEKERKEVEDSRKVALWAAQAQRPDRQVMTTDVAIPISRMADCIAETKADLDKSPLYAPLVGHVGDSNFHVFILFNPDDPTEDEEAHRLNHRMVDRAIAMEGTCTGEHGIGTGKKCYLENELGKPAVDLMRKLKRALDPNNILNPGKVISVSASAEESHRQAGCPV